MKTAMEQDEMIKHRQTMRSFRKPPWTVKPKKIMPAKIIRGAAMKARQTYGMVLPSKISDE